MARPHLVEKEPVGERDLADRLVDITIRLLLAEVLLNVLGIHDGHNPVQNVLIFDGIIDEETYK